MKAWIVSDHHLFRMAGMTLSTPVAIPAEADLCIVAGDVSSELDVSLAYLLHEVAPHMPVVAVLGNHEYYGGTTIDTALAVARKATAGSRVHILENAAVEIGGVRFIGATLWTDFEIPTGEGDENIPAAIRLEIARNDLDVIDINEIQSDRRPGEFVDVDELRDRHLESRAFIKRTLAEPFAGKTVVLSHHAPLVASLDARFAGNLSNSAYASDLSKLIAAGRPDYWIHGHIHQARDYIEAETRIICNPRGFSNDERNGFRPGLVVNI